MQGAAAHVTVLYAAVRCGRDVCCGRFGSRLIGGCTRRTVSVSLCRSVGETQELSNLIEHLTGQAATTLNCHVNTHLIISALVSRVTLPRRCGVLKSSLQDHCVEYMFGFIARSCLSSGCSGGTISLYWAINAGASELYFGVRLARIACSVAANRCGSSVRMVGLDRMPVDAAESARRNHR